MQLTDRNTSAGERIANQHSPVNELQLSTTTFNYHRLPSTTHNYRPLRISSRRSLVGSGTSLDFQGGPTFLRKRASTYILTNYGDKVACGRTGHYLSLEIPRVNPRF